MAEVNKKKRPAKLYVVRWGPDSRHLHESCVHATILAARVHYEGVLAKAKELVRIEYPHRMSEGENRTVLKEQSA
jgi:hypothetical protein